MKKLAKIDIRISDFFQFNKFAYEGIDKDNLKLGKVLMTGGELDEDLMNVCRNEGSN